MRALTWHGKHDVRVDTVPDPEIVNPRDAVIKITSTAICGSDLHLYDGVIPTMQSGDILGHEFMGEVVEIGRDSTLKKGDRVVIPFTIACGSCYFCGKQQYSGCDNSNPVEKQDISEALYGHAMCGIFGYSHMTGGYAGGQAEYARIPFSDFGPIVIPEGMSDDEVLFLSDILPTGWMGAENAEIEDGDIVAVWGCGPVGLFAIQSALVMGAERVIAIDHHAGRLELARKLGAEVINFEQTNIREALMEMTGGIGPDAVIDAVGMEAHGFAVDNMIDTVKQNRWHGRRPRCGAEAGDPVRAQGGPRVDARRLRRHDRQMAAGRLHGEGLAAAYRTDSRPEISKAPPAENSGRRTRYKPF